MEIEKPSRRRRNHTEEFKQAMITACCEAGVSVAGIALANEVNANQVRRWMRERGIEPPSRSLPVRSIPAERGAEPAFRSGSANPDTRLSEFSASIGDGNRLARSRSNEKTPS